MDSRHRLTTRPVANPAAVVQGERVPHHRAHRRPAAAGVRRGRRLRGSGQSTFALSATCRCRDFRVIDGPAPPGDLTDRRAPGVRPRPVQHQRAEHPGPRQRQQLPQRLALRRAGCTTSAAPRGRWTTPTARSRSSPESSPAGASRCSTTRRIPRLGRRRLGRSRATAPGPTSTSSPTAATTPDASGALYAVSGPTPVLPRWALGNWWSRYHPYTRARNTSS